MKRAKMLLVAIAVIAVVGGAYAVKANKSQRNGVLWCSTTLPGTGLTSTTYTISTTGFISFCTTEQNALVTRVTVTKDI